MKKKLKVTMKKKPVLKVTMKTKPTLRVTPMNKNMKRTGKYAMKKMSKKMA